MMRPPTKPPRLRQRGTDSSQVNGRTTKSTSTDAPPVLATSTTAPPILATSTVDPPVLATPLLAGKKSCAAHLDFDKADLSQLNETDPSDTIPSNQSTKAKKHSTYPKCEIIPAPPLAADAVSGEQLSRNNNPAAQLSKTSRPTTESGDKCSTSSELAGSVTPPASSAPIPNRSPSQLPSSQAQPGAFPSTSVSLSPLLTSKMLQPQPTDTDGLQPGVSFILTGHSSKDQPFEKEGTVMKLVNNKWKTRQVHLKPRLRALYYYQSLADSANEGGTRGVYPLLGATVTNVVKAEDGGHMFIITIRNSQMIHLKLPSEREAQIWQVAITLAARQPLPAVSQEVRTCRVEVVRSVGCSARTVRLNTASRYLYTYKKDEMEFLDGVSLTQARVVMEKSYGVHFDISIQSQKEGKIRIRFKSAEEWMSWGEALEVCSTS